MRFITMASLVALILMTTAAISEENKNLRRYFYPGNVVSVLLPAGWKQDDNKGSFAVVSLNEKVSVNGSVFRKTNTQLQDFADGRWEVIKEKQPFYKKIKGPYELEIPTLKAVAADYEGVWPGTKGVTHYLVVCAQSGEKFISLAFTMTEDEFLRNGAFYLKLSKSLRLE